MASSYGSSSEHTNIFTKLGYISAGALAGVASAGVIVARIFGGSLTHPWDFLAAVAGAFGVVVLMWKGKM